ncbi:MAG TPA: hypothetical protein VFM54_20875 [Micromonosporaceae bacterium]|nr:hypothetical protein [Micromonosporaceae bacterium]
MSRPRHPVPLRQAGTGDLARGRVGGAVRLHDTGRGARADVLTFLLCLGTATIGAALGGGALAAITGQPAGEGWPVGLVAVGLVLLLGNVDMQRRP